MWQAKTTSLGKLFIWNISDGKFQQQKDAGILHVYLEKHSQLKFVVYEIMQNTRDNGMRTIDRFKRKKKSCKFLNNFKIGSF